MPANAFDNFHLICLISQADAVQALLAGRPYDEKVAWFAAHGKLSASPMNHTGTPYFLFVSHIGMECLFFIADDDLVFIGDNTNWVVPKRH